MNVSVPFINRKYIGSKNLNNAKQSSKSARICSTVDKLTAEDGYPESVDEIHDSTKLKKEYPILGDEETKTISKFKNFTPVNNEKHHAKFSNLQNLTGVIWTGYSKKVAVLVLQPDNIFNNVYTTRAGGALHYKIPLTEMAITSNNKGVKNIDSFNHLAVERQLELLPAFQMGMGFKINGADCRLIRQILLNHGFSEMPTTTHSQNDFNLLWSGNHLRSYVLRTLQPYQRVNHFPRSYELTRKDRLFKNIQKMQQLKGMRNFDYIPVSFIMPGEFNDLCSVFARERGVWIVKPVASSRGRGIYLISHPDQILLEETAIVSRYVQNPLLIDGFKFDLRLYLAVTSYDPLVAYMYEEGLTRFATVRFDHSLRSIRNSCMHLTNYSINKRNQGYVHNSDADREDVGNKWTLGALLRYLSADGHNTQLLISRMEDIIVRTLLSVQQSISTATKMFAPHRTNCFELYGVDLLIDKNMKPWLLEINLSPSLNCDSPLDLKVKSHMISDLLTLCGMTCIDPHTRRNQYNYIRSNGVQTASKRFQNKPQKNDFGSIYGQAQKNVKNGNIWPHIYNRYGAKVQRSKSSSGSRFSDSSSELTFSSNKQANVTINGRLSRNNGPNKFAKKRLTADEIKFIRRAREENERRHSWIRIFPTKTSWDQYNHLIVGKTSDLILYRHLFEQDESKLENQNESDSPSTYSKPTNSRNKSAMVGHRKVYQYYNYGRNISTPPRNANTDMSKTKGVYKFDKNVYLEMCKQHHTQYIRKLKWGSRRSKQVELKMEQYADKMENVEQVCQNLQNNIDKCVEKSDEADQVQANNDWGHLKTIKCNSTEPVIKSKKSAKNCDIKIHFETPMNGSSVSTNIVTELNENQKNKVSTFDNKTIEYYSRHLNRLRVRKAFSTYLCRVKDRIVISEKKTDYSTFGNDQLGLIKKFLNKATNLIGTSLDDKKCIVDNLSSYIDKYIADTKMDNKVNDKNKKSENLQLSMQIDYFISRATEMQLENLLTFYTKNANCVNAFFTQTDKNNLNNMKNIRSSKDDTEKYTRPISSTPLSNSRNFSKKDVDSPFQTKINNANVDIRSRSALRYSQISHNSIKKIIQQSTGTDGTFKAMQSLLGKKQFKVFEPRSQAKNIPVQITNYNTDRFKKTNFLKKSLLDKNTKPCAINILHSIAPDNQCFNAKNVKNYMKNVHSKSTYPINLKYTIDPTKFIKKTLKQEKIKPVIINSRINSANSPVSMFNKSVLPEGDGENIKDKPETLESNKERKKLFLIERLEQSSRLLAESRCKHDTFIKNNYNSLSHTKKDA